MALGIQVEEGRGQSKNHMQSQTIHFLISNLTLNFDLVKNLILKNGEV